MRRLGVHLPASQQPVSNSETAFQNLDATFVEQGFAVRHTFRHQSLWPSLAVNSWH